MADLFKKTSLLQGIYEAPITEALFLKQKRFSIDSELSYSNNPSSLFRKYAILVTWFANNPYGKEYLGLSEVKEEIALFVPNGYHLVRNKTKNKVICSFTFSTRPIFASLLYPALRKIDLIQSYLTSFEETQEMLFWLTGITKGISPQINRQFLFDTSTFYPDSNPETTTVDGLAGRGDAGGLTWADMHDGNGTLARDSSSNDQFAYLESLSSGNKWRELDRSFTLFDTSSIPDLATITSAIESLYITAKVDNFSQSIRLVQTTIASNTAVVASDYEGTVGNTTAQATDISLASININAYNDWTLNATGIGNINKSGITKFGFKVTGDATNTEPSWSAGLQAYILCDTVDQTGTITDPKLTVNFTTTSTSTSTSTTTTSTSTTTTTSTSTSSSTSTTTTSTSTTTTSTSTTTTSTSTTTTSTSSSSTTSSSSSTTLTLPFSFRIEDTY